MSQMEERILDRVAADPLGRFGAQRFQRLLGPRGNARTVG